MSIKEENLNILRRIKPDDKIYIKFDINRTPNYFKAIPVNMKLLNRPNKLCFNELSTILVEFDNKEFTIDEVYIDNNIQVGDTICGLLCFTQNKGNIKARLPIGICKDEVDYFYNSFPDNIDDFTLATNILVEKNIQDSKIKYQYNRLYVLE